LQQILSPNEDAEFGFIKTPGFIWVNLTKEWPQLIVKKRRQWCLCFYPFREGNDWWSRIRDQRWLGNLGCQCSSNWS
jgi:hypothetical protein